MFYCTGQYRSVTPPAPYIPNDVKLNRTIHQGKSPNYSNVFSNCTCEFKKSWLLDGKGKELSWRCYAVVHKKWNLKWVNILQDIGFSAVSNAPASKSELWIILLCSYSTPSTPFFCFQILHFHLRCSQASLTWCVNSAGPCPGKSGWEGALLSFLSHPHWSPPSTVWQTSHLCSYSFFLTWDLRKKSWKISASPAVGSRCPSLVPSWSEDVPKGQLVWPSLYQGQDRHHWPRLRTRPADQRRDQPSAHPKPGVLA